MKIKSIDIYKLQRAIDSDADETGSLGFYFSDILVDDVGKVTFSPLSCELEPNDEQLPAQFAPVDISITPTGNNTVLLTCGLSLQVEYNASNYSKSNLPCMPGDGWLESRIKITVGRRHLQTMERCIEEVFPGHKSNLMNALTVFVRASLIAESI